MIHAWSGPWLLVLLLCGVAAPKDVQAVGSDAWRSRVVLFALTDRFARSPGLPADSDTSCNLMGWNGGTWAGMAARLGYVQDALGASAVWITAVPKQFGGETFGETAYHGYWAVDWSRVEPRLGSEADLTALVNAAHARGLLMMLDVVANHAGPVASADLGTIVPFSAPEHYHDCSSPALQRACTEWCAIPDAAYDAAPPDTFAIQHCRLINLLDLNQTHPFVRRELFAWTGRARDAWGFDGLRLDTVKHVPNAFWADFTDNAGMFTLGEVFNGDTESYRAYLQPDASGRQPMHALLNFPLYWQLRHGFADQRDLRALQDERRLQLAVLGAAQVGLLGSFIDSHDVDLWLSLQPQAELMHSALTWLLLGPGIPILYYASAAGLAGRTAGGANRGCLWAGQAPYDGGTLLARTIRTLARLRASHELWRQPDFSFESVSASCYVFAPASAAGPVLAVTTNRGDANASSEQACSLLLPDGFGLLEAGPQGVTDLLDFSQGEGSAAQGLTWEPANRRLTVATPGGRPRVLLARAAAAAGASGNSSSSSSGSSLQPAAGGLAELAQRDAGQQQAQQASGAAQTHRSSLAALLAAGALLLLATCIT